MRSVGIGIQKYVDTTAPTTISKGENMRLKDWEKFWMELLEKYEDETGIKCIQSYGSRFTISQVLEQVRKKWMESQGLEYSELS